MNTEENKQMVLEGYQLFRNGDISNLLARFREDAVWTTPESDVIPFTGQFHGRQGIAEFFRKLDAAVQSTSLEISDLIAEGDRVVVIGRGGWHTRLTGRDYDTPWVHVFTLRDGMVARLDTYYDTAPAAAALQALQPAQAARPDLRQ